MVTLAKITAEQFLALHTDQPCRQDLIEGELWTILWPSWLMRRNDGPSHVD